MSRGRRPDLPSQGAGARLPQRERSVPAPASTGAEATDEPAVTADDLQRLARGSSQNLAGSAVNAAFSVVLPVVLARGLDRDAAGTFFAVSALFTIAVNVGTLGADTGLLRGIARSRALGRQAELPALMRAALLPVAVLSTLLALLLVLLGPRIAALVVSRTPGQPAGFEDVLHVLVLFLPVAVLYTTGLSASRGFGSLAPLVVLEKVGRGAVQTAFVAAAVSLAPTLGVLALAWSAPYLLAALVLVAWLRRLYRRALAEADGSGPAPRPPAQVARELWAFSGPRAVSRVFSVALQRVDILLVGGLLGSGEAAVYAAATRFLVLGLLFVQAVQQVMAPRISELLAREDLARARALYRTTTTWLTIVSWPLYLLSAVFPVLLLSIFGPEYERGAPAVVLLCLSMLVATSCGPVDTLLLMAGRSRWSLRNTGLALAVNVVLDLLLVPRIGLTGAALGWVVAILVNNLLPLAQVHRLLGMHPFSPGLRLVALTATACFGLLPLLVRAALGATLPALLLAALVGGTTYTALLLLRQRELELDALLGVLRGAGRGAPRRGHPERV